MSTNEKPILRRIHRGLRRAVKANEQHQGRSGTTATERRLDDLCCRDPDIVRETLEELARMRAGWQNISYDKALGQLLDATEKPR